MFVGPSTNGLLAWLTVPRAIRHRLCRFFPIVSWLAFAPLPSSAVPRAPVHLSLRRSHLCCCSSSSSSMIRSFSHSLGSWGTVHTRLFDACLQGLRQSARRASDLTGDRGWALTRLEKSRLKRQPWRD